MEKQTQAKHKSKIMRFLPKATSSVSFQNPPPENNPSKFKSHLGGGKGFSGPMISIIPAEARGRCRGKYGSIFDTPEPTSPKISCMGQIQHKKKIHKMKKRVASSSQTQQQPPPKPPVVPAPPHDVASSKPKELKKQTSMTLRRIFGRTKSSAAAGRKSDASADRPRKAVLPERTPSLSQMRRFASGRDTFANFDWTAHQVAPVDSDHHRDYYSDEERGDREDEEEKEVIIPFSAPMCIGGGCGVALEPRKEINLWKRRTMDPPRPLQLNTHVMSK